MSNDPIPTPDISDGDPMAADSETVFKNREILRPQYVPEGERIVGRDGEIQNVEAILKPAAHGEPPENAFLFGETGTGKSLVAKHVTGRAKAISEMNDVAFVTAYIDCDQYNTETRAAREMTHQVEAHVGCETEIPDNGIGASKYYDYLWGRNGMLHEVESLAVILDEIDLLGDDAPRILSKLSRSEEAGKTDCYVGVLAISNKTDYTSNDDERVSSSFQEEPIDFPPYNATQLQDILTRRKDAFKDGVVSTGSLKLTAALAARDYGDARQALDLLRTAGKLADKQGESTVTDQHVRDADEYVDLSRSVTVVQNGTKHSRYALYAIAHLTQERSKNRFSTGEIYDVYKLISHILTDDMLSHQRILDLLKEWSLPDITEHHHTGRGHGNGSARMHRLLHDPEIIKSAAISDEDQAEDVEEVLETAGY